MQPDPSFRTYVDLGILESFFQVVVDCLIGYLAKQRQVRHADLLLFGAFEDGFLDLLPPPITGGSGTCCRIGVFLAPSTLGDGL